MLRRSPSDAAAVFLCVLIAFAATVVGLRTGWHPADADEIVYRDTLVFMRHGANVYQAERRALIIKEHQPPTSVRAIRPPTLFLVLRWFPPGSWRWLVGIVYLADLLAVWRLARAHGPPAGLLAVAFAGVWILGFSSYLFLHAEVWGLPFFLGGLLCLRRDRPWAAASLFLVASCIRELYVVGLVGGSLLVVAPLLAGAGWSGIAPKLRPWATATLAAIALFGVHAALAESVLSSHGYNARFGNEHRTVAFLLRLVAPLSSGVGEFLGVALVVLGVVGGLRVLRADRAAAVAVCGAAFLLAASIWATRVYWSACWAVPLAAYAPVAILGSRDERSAASPSRTASHTPVITRP